ncbi:serine/threonine-protein phosphatase 5 [Hyposmocoma kahamanoa]|uniref:serine/threonine-protein phosphatase 5 n=1 Tax=Hyposmocoma kahamanoa TaxID=1477025 RepID=UPI000E6D8932|nr:serine/threonine-protein phosphatase 5 [Hyposmocoma kahamanoa]
MSENEEIAGTIPQEDIEAAEKLKNEANELFKKQNYNGAIELYTQAIKKNWKNAVYFANRSISNLRLENFGYALSDASKAIELDKTYTKAYYRRAAAHMSLGKYKLALKDFEYVTKVRPNDQDAKLKYSECNKIVKKIAFEKAISVDKKEVNIADSINLDVMTIEDEYEGPALEDGKVTLKFVTELMEYYKQQKKLHKKYAYKILIDVKSYLQTLPSLVDIKVPDNQKFTVCGDIHGQFYDLMNIFKLNGLPSQANPYLFNGDFVDRGSFSVECIFTLFSFKLLYPDHFYMSRGNHETLDMNRMYGFRGEVTSKYSSQMADLFTEVYNWLPLAHCINNRVLVMHGGLFSKDDVTLEDIRKVDRNKQPPEDGIMCELLWSDPQPMLGRAPSKRGVGCQFGPDVTTNFLQRNGLDYVIRSHEVKNDGYEVAHDGKCITVFSAPNYCDTMGNLGAFITMNGKDLKPNFTTYEAVPHPDVKPMAYANSFLSMLCQ